MALCPTPICNYADVYYSGSDVMSKEGLITLLEQEIRLSNQQLRFNEKNGEEDEYERGYRDALKMVLKNVREMKC